MPARQRLRPFLWSVLLLLHALTAPAWAQRSSDVETLIRKGSELRRQGKDHLALPYYQRAYDASPTGRTAAQLGLCEMQLGYFLLASDHLGEALASSGDPWVEKYRSVLAQSQRSVRAHIVELDLSGTPPGAEVLIDEKSVAHLPLSAPLRVIAGPSHKVRLRADGYPDVSETIAGHGGETIKLSLNMAKPPLVPLPQAQGAARTDLTGGAQSQSPGSPEARSGSRVAAWWTAAGAVAFLAAGSVELAVASKHLNNFQNTPSQTDPGRTCGTDQPSNGGSKCQDLHDAWSRARTLGFVGIAAGAALAATSTGFWLVSSRPAPSRSVACAPAFGIRGIVCERTF